MVDCCHNDNMFCTTRHRHGERIPDNVTSYDPCEIDEIGDGGSTLIQAASDIEFNRHHFSFANHVDFNAIVLTGDVVWFNFGTEQIRSRNIPGVLLATNFEGPGFATHDLDTVAGRIGP